MWFYFRKRDLLWLMVKAIFTPEKEKRKVHFPVAKRPGIAKVRKPKMKTFTEEEVSAATNVDGGDLEYDNHGQLIIYTGIFRWSDGTFRDEPEETDEDDEG